MYLRKILFLLAFCMIVHANTSLEKKITADLKERMILGYNCRPAVCIVTSDKVSYLLPHEASSTRDLYEIGSVTKFFTAHLCLLLHEEGKIDLYHPIGDLVQKVFPHAHPSLSKKTLYDLLTHTSGLIDPETEDYFNECTGNTIAVVDFSLTEIDQYLSKQALDNFVESPIYSNLGYILVGLLIEKKTNQDYSSLLKYYILDPLEISETFIGMPDNTSLVKIKGYSQGRGVPYWKTEQYSAFASIVSTPRDLGIYFQHVIFNTGQSDLFKSLSKTPFQLKDMQVQSGLGWSLDKRYGGHLHVLTGRTLGFSSFIGWDPERCYAIIFLSDSDTFGNMPFRWLHDAFPQDHLHRAIPIEDGLIKKMKGTYVEVSSSEERFTIDATGQFLLLRGEGKVPLILYRSANEMFFTKWLYDNCFFSFREEEDDLVVYEIRDSKERMIAKKVR